MNGIIGMTHLLLDTELKDDQRDFAETVRSSADYLLTIINDILDFSKIEAGQLTLHESGFSIRGLIDGVLDLLADRAGQKDLELVCVVDRDLPEWWVGDAGRLRQVLTNLLGNGIKFTESGFVRLQVEANGGRGLRFVVEDSGIGIHGDAIPKLFQPFYQVDGSTTRKFGGTGLGLAISRQIVDSMRGSMQVESSQGQGSRFSFEVPMMVVSGAAPPEPWPSGEGRTALVADPNPASRAALRDQLAGSGFVVFEAANAEGAIDHLRGGRNVEVVFADLRLDVASIARYTLGALFLLSPSRRRQGEAPAGAAGVLNKPIRERALRDALRRVVSESGNSEPALRNLAGSLNRDRGSEPMRGRILIAEDNAVNQRVAANLIGRRGYTVDVVHDGKSAIDSAQDHSYTLILMDCHMPLIDGFEATRRIRENEGPDRRSIIIAMTARAMRGDRERCLDAGMDDYLSKPLEPRELDRVLEKWAGHGRQFTQAAF